MKFLFIGDCHLTNHTPHCRLDEDYTQTQFNKLNWIFDYAMNNGVSSIVCVGDFLDTIKFPLHFTNRIIDLLKELNLPIANIPFYSCRGNHEIYFRNHNSKNTTFSILENIGLIKTSNITHSNVKITLCHYNEPIPEPVEGLFNILVIHAGISEEEAWWQEKSNEKWWTGKEFLAEHKYQLVFSGHNHKRFKVETRMGKQRLYNCGSVCRSSVDQVNHIPAFYVFDTDTKEVTEVEIPIEKAELVIDINSHDEAKRVNEQIASFVDGFSSETEILLDFESVLWETAKDVKAGPEINKILEKCIAVGE
jgi:DNA repair exonuclease SbcCD nuclease subunit